MNPNQLLRQKATGALFISRLSSDHSIELINSYDKNYFIDAVDNDQYECFNHTAQNLTTHNPWTIIQHRSSKHVYLARNDCNGSIMVFNTIGSKRIIPETEGFQYKNMSIEWENRGIRIIISPNEINDGQKIYSIDTMFKVNSNTHYHSVLKPIKEAFLPNYRVFSKFEFVSEFSKFDRFVDDNRGNLTFSVPSFYFVVNNNDERLVNEVRYMSRWHYAVWNKHTLLNSEIYKCYNDNNPLYDDEIKTYIQERNQFEKQIKWNM